MLRSGDWIILLAVPMVAEDPGGLVDVRAQSGIEFITESGGREKRNILSSLGGGVALLDYDGDGDLDVYLVRHGQNGLYRGVGGWRFQEVTELARVGDTGWGIGCAAGDFDNDGLVDLYVTNLGGNLLYRNRGDGTFEDISREAGVADEGFGSSSVFFDADGDGDLDLYVTNYVEPNQSFPEPGSEPTCLWLGMAVMCGPRGLEGQEDVFYRNEGSRFVESTKEAGLRDSGRAYGLGAVSADYDDDGDADLYVANDTNPNFLYRNDGSGRFEDVGLLSGVAYNGSGATEAGMGVDFGDANGDGRLDLFVTNFSHETNTLYLGSEGRLFTDATEEAGLSTSSLGKLGWGTRFVDLDLDGDEDLFVANGHVYPNVSDVDSTTSYEQRDQVYWNDGTGNFSEAGVPTDGLNGPKASRGAAFGDLDGDGDPDIVAVAIDDQPAVLRNDLTADAHWIGIVLVGRKANRDGAGAKLRLLSGSRGQTKTAHASGSIFSSSDLRVLFGLGDGARVDEVAIDWPGGGTTRLLSVPADRYLVVIEGVEASGWFSLK